jgi:hypothetical protein
MFFKETYKLNEDISSLTSYKFPNLARQYYSELLVSKP